MFRLVLLLVALSANLVATQALAQFYVGGVAGGGVSYSTFFEEPLNSDFSSTPSFGYDVGVMASMRVHNNFLLNVQMLYADRGKIIEGSNGAGRSDQNTKVSSRLQYLEFPIFYVVEFKKASSTITGQGGRTKSYNWFVGLGPTISYWLGSSGTLQSSFLKENFIEDVEYTAVFGQTEDLDKESIEEPNRWQFALNITGGLTFEPAPGHRVVTMLQLSIAQTILGTKDGYFPVSFVDVDPLRVKNHSLRLSAAYLFDTKLDKQKRGKSTVKQSRRKRR